MPGVFCREDSTFAPAPQAHARERVLLVRRRSECLRAINGSLNWLATQSRPDLSTQVSFSQKSFPNPAVGDALAANQAVRRARQHASMSLVYKSIPVSELTVMCHSDAAYANAREGATQAGYVVSFTSNRMHDGHTTAWTPAGRATDCLA